MTKQTIAYAAVILTIAFNGSTARAGFTSVAGEAYNLQAGDGSRDLLIHGTLPLNMGPTVISPNSMATISAAADATTSSTAWSISNLDATLSASGLNVVNEDSLGLDTFIYGSVGPPFGYYFWGSTFQVSGYLASGSSITYSVQADFENLNAESEAPFIFGSGQITYNTPGAFSFTYTDPLHYIGNYGDITGGGGNIGVEVDARVAITLITGAGSGESTINVDPVVGVQFSSSPVLSVPEPHSLVLAVTGLLSSLFIVRVRKPAC